MFYFVGSCRFCYVCCGVSVVFVHYCFVVVCYYLFHVLHAAVVLFRGLCSLCVDGKQNVDYC